MSLGTRYKSIPQLCADAIAVQSACNPSGVAFALIDGIRYLRSIGENPETHPATRLMAHQLSYLMRVDALSEARAYSSAYTFCDIAAGAL